MPIKLQVARPGLTVHDARSVKPAPKAAAPVYQSAAYLAWRDAVVRRAGGRCEAIDAGQRCPKASPRHRVFADHKREVRDGGAVYDVDNGECLCGAHHTRKTAVARASRRFA